MTYAYMTLSEFIFFASFHATSMWRSVYFGFTEITHFEFMVLSNGSGPKLDQVSFDRFGQKLELGET